MHDTHNPWYNHKPPKNSKRKTLRSHRFGRQKRSKIRRIMDRITDNSMLYAY